MSIKLIAFDLDGTLLDNRKNIPEKNLAALRAAGQTGILLVPATGRIYSGIPEAIRTLPGARYSLTINGASAYDAVEDKSLSSNEMSPELSLRVIEYMETLPVLYDCYQDNWGYISKAMYDRAEAFIPDPGILKLMHTLRTPVGSLAEHIRALGHPVQKLQMHFTDLAERQRQLELLPKLFPECAISSSLPWNIEINSASATKGQALLGLCAALGIDIHDTMAFGDGSNDYDMIKTAGVGVAMSNAIPELKAAADWIAPSNEDSGVAAGIYKFVDM